MKSAKAGNIVKLSVLRRPKHRTEAALNVIIVELCIRDTDRKKCVSTWLLSSLF